MKQDKNISEDEAALYDRQIRLWGVEAQKKLINSKILIINMNGLAAEIAKNLVLSGINCLTLLDSTDVTEADLKLNFLLPHTSVGENRAESSVEALRTLNPMVKIQADKARLADKDQEFFSAKNFDIICALINDCADLERIDLFCRETNVMFLSGYVCGLYGYMFVDFNEFNYIVEAARVTDDDTEKEKEKKKIISKSTTAADKEADNQKLELVEKNVKFNSYAKFLKNFAKPLENLSPIKLKRVSKAFLLALVFNRFYETYKRSFVGSDKEDFERLLKVKRELFESLKVDQELLSDAYLSEQDYEELSAVNAIIGGTMGQEIIKAISKKNEPFNNFFCFDGNVMNGEVMQI
jgi:ubiquitin-like 1-activating enzyme E1 A